MVPESGVTLQQFPDKAVALYGEVEFAWLDRKLAMFRALSAADRDLLPEFEQRISAIVESIEANANLLSLMAQSAQSIHSPSATGIPRSAPAQGETTEPNGKFDAEHSDDEKQLLSRVVRRGFTLLVRDWSALGAGSGRLPWEPVRRCFVVEGCEMSFTALLVGNYALNSASAEDVTTIFPFAHEHSNVRSQEAALRPVYVPDVNPKDIPHVADFAMRAGNFVEAYDGQDNSWHAVASCMAFDLGDGVIEHVRRVSQILKPGGVWAFVGPVPCLDGGQMEGIHLSVEEFMGIVRKIWFKIVKREEVECLHSPNPTSLRSIHIKCPFVVAVKVRPAVLSQKPPDPPLTNCTEVVYT